MTSGKTERLLTRLSEFNVTDLETQNIFLEPIYNYTDSPMRILGFESTNDIVYTIDPMQAGPFLDAAVQAGATISSVTVGASAAISEEAYFQALSLASSDAQKKADIVAKGLNVCITGLHMVNVEPDTNPTPTIMYEMMQADAMATQSSLMAC